MASPPDFVADLLALFAEREAPLVDVPLIQPADPFLDMAGEDLRRRIFLTESETGESLCLRPEFTIPVCLDHIASRASTPRRYSYFGEVFRQRREGGNEFFQAGIEDLGETDIAAADARSVIDAAALFARLLPQRQIEIMIGDQAVFEAVLAALGLPRGWQKRLARAFGSPGALAAALADLTDPPVSTMLEEPAASLVMGGEEDQLAAHILQRMRDSGISPHAGRAPEEIARRLIEKSDLRSVRLSDRALAALRAFLAIRVPLDTATEALDSFAAGSGLSLSDALSRFAARARQLALGGLDTSLVTYDAAFGRPLDYYTGLVFEVALVGSSQPLAGGGRYDRLLTLLGAKQPIPGVGFSVWLDRIGHLREQAQ